MIKIDMWYGDDYKEADRISINFYDLSSTYAGNIYKGGKCVGDYVSDDSIEIENTFNWLIFNWD